MAKEYKNKKGATGKKYTTVGDVIKVTYTDGSTRVVRPSDASYAATKKAMEQDVGAKKWYKPAGNSKTTAETALGTNGTGAGVVTTEKQNQQYENYSKTVNQRRQNDITPKLTKATPVIPTNAPALQKAQAMNQAIAKQMPDAYKNMAQKAPSTIGYSVETGINQIKGGAKSLPLIVAQDLLTTAKGRSASIDRVTNPLNRNESLGDTLRRVAAQQAQEQESIQKKYGYGNWGELQQMAGDVGSGIVNMAPSLLVGGGTGLALLAGTAMGNAANKAVNEGAELNDAATYGIRSGAIEAGTELLGKGIPGLPGVVKGSKVLQKVPGNKVLGAALDIGLEGAEEAVSEALDPINQRTSYNPTAENATMEELTRAALMGSVTSGLLKGAVAGANRVIGPNNNATIPHMQENEQKQVQKQGENAQKPQNGLKQPTLEDARKQSMEPVKMPETEKYEAEFNQDSGKNVQNVKSMDITPKLEKVQPKITLEMSERTFENVGDKNVKAYQQENPAVKPFYQKTADNLLADLQEGIKGGRDAGIDPETRTVTTMGGWQRQQSEPIERMLRDGMTYNQIEDGLQRIVEDHGKENTANAKRAELYIDDAVRKGYRSVVEGDVSADRAFAYRGKSRDELQQIMEQLDNSFTGNAEQDAAIISEMEIVQNLLDGIQQEQGTVRNSRTVAENATTTIEPTTQENRAVEPEPSIEKFSEVDSEPDYEDYDVSQLPKDVFDFYNQVGEVGGKAHFNIRIVKNLEEDAEGRYDGHGNILVSAERANDIETVRRVVAHEVYHAMKDTEQWGEIQDFAYELYKLENPNGTQEQMLQAKIDQYYERSGGKVQLDAEGAWDEIGAELMGKILSDPVMADRIWNQNPTLAQSIVQWLKEKISSIQNRLKGNSKEYGIYKEALEAYSEGLRNMEYRGQSSETGETRYAFRDIPYDDKEQQNSIQQQTHQTMVDDGQIVTVSEGVLNEMEQYYPDLRHMKKKERNPIIKAKVKELKKKLRKDLNSLKYVDFEFEIDGDILTARLYDTGIREVLEKMTEPKAAMLSTSTEIFENAKYMYSTDDYDGDPNIERWNYFYTPVQIGDDIVGVRIAIKDLKNPKESQIYNWGIKKEASLDGAGRLPDGSIPSGISSDASISGNIVPENQPKVNDGTRYSLSKDNTGKRLTEQQEQYFKNSKVRDENGNLKVMYHGSEWGGFTVFDRKMSDDNASFFFTDSPTVAKSYSGTDRKYNPVDAVADEEALNYEVYLDLQNPYIVDANGDSWNNLPILDELSDYDFEWGKMSTRDYAYYARENGYDGVIFKNIIDSSVHATDAEAFETSTVAVAFYPEQIKDVENKKPTADPDIRFSIGQKRDSASSQEYKDLLDEHGSIPEGEDPTGENYRVEVPRKAADGKKVREFVRTIMEAPSVDDAVANMFAQELIDPEQVLSGILTMESTSNKARVDAANEVLNQTGWQQSYRDLHGKMTSGERVTAQDVALATRVAQEAQKAGDAHAAFDILTDLVVASSELAQGLQAVQILKRLSPEGQLMALIKTQKRINDNLRKQGKKPIKTMSEETAAEFLNARSPKKRDEIRQREIARMAQETEGNWLDKLNAIRYACMLSNPKTHIRNIIGNFVMQAAYIPRNAISGALQDFRSWKSKELRPAGFEKTHSLSGTLKNKTGNTGKELRKYADYYYHHEAEQLLRNIGNRYDDVSGEFASQQRVFGNSLPGRVLEQAAGKGKYSVGSALDAEDMLFKKLTYKNALIDYMKANGISIKDARSGTAKPNGASIAKGHAYAFEQAQKATFTEDNSFAEWLSKGEKQFGLAGTIGFGSIMPFKKTPLNILSRGVEFSPVGAGMTVYKLYHAFSGKETKSGKTYDINDVMDSIGANMTGSAILALGMYLASQELLVAAGDDDDQIKARYDSQMGDQNFAVVNPETGESWTIDWLAPSAMPLLTGVEVYNQIFGNEEEVDDDILNRALASAAKIADPVFEMSCMQGVASALASYSGDAGDIASSLMANVATGIAGQYIPQPLSAAAKTVDDTVRSSYASKESHLLGGKTTETFLRQQRSKIPVMSEQNEPSIDVWGNERKREFAGDEPGQIAKRALNNFLAPWNYSSNKRTDLDVKLESLYEETGDNAVLPKSADNYVTHDGKTYYKTPFEKTRYDTTKGQKSKKYVSDFVNSSDYRNMSDSQKVDIVKNLYDLANYQAKKEMLAHRGVMYMDEQYEKVLKSKISPSSYYTMADAVSDITGDGQKDRRIAYLQEQKNAGKLTDEQFWYMRKTHTGKFNKSEMAACPYDWIKQL